jgi:hypothetical protein
MKDQTMIENKGKVGKRLTKPTRKSNDNIPTSLI